MKKKKVFKFILIFLISLFISSYSFCHGFDPRIYINTSVSKNRLVPIKLLCEDCLDGTQTVCSFDQAKNKCVKSKITSAATAQTNVYVAIHFNNDPCEDIICTPEQEFYTSHKQWVPAYQLEIGDSLFCKNKILQKISHIRLVKEPITVYAIRVKRTHTFFVGRNAVLTHNMLLLPFTAGVGAAFASGAGAGALATSLLGPITVVAGLTAGGLLAIAVKTVFGKNKLPQYEISYATGIFDGNFNEDAEKTIRQPTSSQSCGGGMPDPEDPNDWKKKKKKIKKSLEKDKIKNGKLEESVRFSTTDNNLRHFFKNKKSDHHFDKLSKQFGNIDNVDVQKKIVREVIKKLIESDRLPAEGVFKEIPVKIEGETVMARGFFVDGVIKLGTIFIKG